MALDISPSSMRSQIKVSNPPVLPYFKPLDYVDFLSQIHSELESCNPHERSNLYLLRYLVFRGLGDYISARRNLRLAWLKASTVHERIVFGAWLKYEKRGQEPMSDLLLLCRHCAKDFEMIDIGSELPFVASPGLTDSVMVNENDNLTGTVTFRIGDEKIRCERQKIASLSTSFRSLVTGGFAESISEEIDLSKYYISPRGFRAIREFSSTGVLPDLPIDLLLEILVLSSMHLSENLKDACERNLAKLISSRNDAVILMEYALQKNCPILAASCLQVLLRELPDSLRDERVVHLLTRVNGLHRSILAGSASFFLYCLLSEVAMDLDPGSDDSALFLEMLVDCVENGRQKMVAHHMLGCVRLLKNDYHEAERAFQVAVDEGHIYSVIGLTRIGLIRGQKLESYKMMSSVISKHTPLGWMYQEKSLYCIDDEKRWKDLDQATELDPTLIYPYMYRAAFLMKKLKIQEALVEIDKILGFKLAVECLELRSCLSFIREDFGSALRDVQVILTISPDHRMFGGRVPATQFQVLVRERLPQLTTSDYRRQLYDRWSVVDDIGALSVIFQMIESETAKGGIYFRQHLLLLRLKCGEAAMRSLQLARRHTTSDHERLVYEGWIYHDTGHRDACLRKAAESLRLNASNFEAFYLKAYALYKTDPSAFTRVVELLQDALACPSNKIRRGQSLGNLTLQLNATM